MQADFTCQELQAIKEWMGTDLPGTMRGSRVIRDDVRISVHNQGFLVFLPATIWRALDCRVPISFPNNPNRSCRMADRDFTFIKAKIDPESGFDYVSPDLGTALQKVEQFVENNYFNNVSFYPKDSRFTHGACCDHPKQPLPFRAQCENLEYKF